MLSRDELADLLRRMYRIRLFEERLKEYYDYSGYFQPTDPGAELERSAGLLTSTLYDFASRGMIGGAVHLSIGQEAVAVGICSLLRDSDYVTSSHRDHGHFIAKTANLRGALAELMGRAGGVCGGCGGSMHLYDRQRGFLGGNGIIGGQIPLALGPAFAARYNGTDQVAVTFFGDGGANQGTLYEALNLAANWSLPVLFVCENNLYAATTPAAIAFPGPDIAPRAEGFGVPAVIVDGQDVLAVRAVGEEAIARARAGHGPTFIEAKTYRFEGHCGSAGHAAPDECARWRQRDPIELFRSRCRAEGWLTEPQQDEIRAAVCAEVEEAVAFALQSPFPDPGRLCQFEF